MNRYRKGASWWLAGGFNREPKDIKLLKDQENLVKANENTRKDKLLDYFKYGTPNQRAF